MYRAYVENGIKRGKRVNHFGSLLVHDAYRREKPALTVQKYVHLVTLAILL